MLYLSTKNETVISKAAIGFEVKEFNELITLSEHIVNKDVIWCPGTFLDGHRLNAKFQKAILIGLDFDEGFTLAEAKERFKSYKHIIATTRNHQKDKLNDKGEVKSPAQDRFRVVLVLEKEITKEEVWLATWTKLVEWNPENDPQTKNCARVFYPSQEVIEVQEEGKNIEVATYIPVIAKQQAKVNSLKVEKINLSRKALEFFAFSAPDGRGNELVRDTAIECKSKGWSEEQFIEKIRHLDDGRFLQGDKPKTISYVFNNDNYGTPPPPSLPDLVGLKEQVHKRTERKNNSFFLFEGVDVNLYNNTLTQFACPSNNGKSSSITNIVVNVLKQGKKVMLLLNEENCGEYFEGLEKLDAEITDTAIETEQLVMYDDDTSQGATSNYMELVDFMKRKYDLYKPDLIIVDLISYVIDGKNGKDFSADWQKINFVSRRLKDLINSNEECGAILYTQQMQNPPRDKKTTKYSPEDWTPDSLLKDSKKTFQNCTHAIFYAIEDDKNGIAVMKIQKVRKGHQGNRGDIYSMVYDFRNGKIEERKKLNKGILKGCCVEKLDTI